MTKQELVKLLEEFPDDAEVTIPTGIVAGVEADEDGVVLLYGGD